MAQLHKTFPSRRRWDGREREHGQDPGDQAVPVAGHEVLGAQVGVPGQGHPLASLVPWRELQSL